MVRPRVESDARELAGDRALEAPGIARLPSGLRVRYPHSVIPFILGTRPFLRR